MEQRLIIELDGGQHAEQTAYDQRRDAWLRCQGYTLLRFWNNEVMQQLEGVLEQVRLTCTVSSALADSRMATALSPGLSPASGREETSGEEGK